MWTHHVNWAQIKSKVLFWQNPAVSLQELILDRRRVYIVPSKTGFTYLVLLIMIFIAAINFNLNLGYALTFILATAAIVDMLYTFRNLAGLGLLSTPPQPVFAGETAQFTLHLANRNPRPRYAIGIGFTKETMQMADIPATSNGIITLNYTSTQRGWYQCPRIRLHTSFPMGLFNAWAYLQTDKHLLVYPAPEQGAPELPYTDIDGEQSLAKSGHDEFSGVRNYHPGDSPKNLAWRQMARQSGGDNDVLLSKVFSGGQQKMVLLDFSALAVTLSTEQKLSRLCAWALRAEKQGLVYGFKLGSHYLSPSNGERHQRNCLIELALFSTDTRV